MRQDNTFSNGNFISKGNDIFSYHGKIPVTDLNDLRTTGIFEIDDPNIVTDANHFPSLDFILDDLLININNMYGPSSGDIPRGHWQNTSLFSNNNYAKLLEEIKKETPVKFNYFKNIPQSNGSNNGFNFDDFDPYKYNATRGNRLLDKGEINWIGGLLAGGMDGSIFHGINAHAFSAMLGEGLSLIPTSFSTMGGIERYTNIYDISDDVFDEYKEMVGGPYDKNTVHFKSGDLRDWSLFDIKTFGFQEYFDNNIRIQYQMLKLSDRKNDRNIMHMYNSMYPELASNPHDQILLHHGDSIYLKFPDTENLTLTELRYRKLKYTIKFNASQGLSNDVEKYLWYPYKEYLYKIYDHYFNLKRNITGIIEVLSEDNLTIQTFYRYPDMSVWTRSFDPATNTWNEWATEVPTYVKKSKRNSDFSGADEFYGDNRMVNMGPLFAIHNMGYKSKVVLKPYLYEMGIVGYEYGKNIKGTSKADLEKLKKFLNINAKFFWGNNKYAFSEEEIYKVKEDKMQKIMQIRDDLLIPDKEIVMGLNQIYDDKNMYVNVFSDEENGAIDFNDYQSRVSAFNNKIYYFTYGYSDFTKLLHLDRNGRLVNFIPINDGQLNSLCTINNKAVIRDYIYFGLRRSTSDWNYNSRSGYMYTGLFSYIGNRTTLYQNNRYQYEERAETNLITLADTFRPTPYDTYGTDYASFRIFGDDSLYDKKGNKEIMAILLGAYQPYISFKDRSTVYDNLINTDYLEGINWTTYQDKFEKTNFVNQSSVGSRKYTEVLIPNDYDITGVRPCNIKIRFIRMYTYRDQRLGTNQETSEYIYIAPNDYFGRTIFSTMTYNYENGLYSDNSTAIRSASGNKDISYGFEISYEKSTTKEGYDSIKFYPPADNQNWKMEVLLQL